MNRFAPIIVCLAVLAVAGPARAGGLKDEKLGYQVGRPPGWQQIPVGLSEKWIVAKFVSKKQYRTMGEDGWMIEFKPDMRVIVFPFEVTKQRGPRKEKIETEDGTVITRFGFQNPYKDYRDYLKKNYTGGGWYVSKEEEKSKKDLSWTLWEIKVEKQARDGKKRLVAGIFHAGDADFVVQFEVLEDSYAKLRNTIYGCLNSFKFIPRTGALVEKRDPARERPPDEGDLTPAERKKLRLASVKEAFEKAKSQLPKSWSGFEYKGKFFVLSHVDRKSALEMLNPGVAVWTWLDKNFAFLGNEYVRPLIVRICATSEEADAYRDTSGDSWWSSVLDEVVLYKRESGGLFFFTSWGGLTGRVMSNWFRDKDRDLYREFPSWLQTGLQNLFGSAKIKGSRLVFPPAAQDVRSVRIAAARGELKPVKELIRSTWGSFGERFSSQSAAFVRFLLIGPGRSMKRTKGFLERYFMAVKEEALAREKRRGEEMKEAVPEKRPKTEEEEDEEFRKRRQGLGGEDWEKKQREHLKAILARAFGDWSEADWKSVDKAYRAFMLR